MLRIGITGGIGSGKTTIANLFLDLGVPVIDSDVIARSLLDPGEKSYTEVVNLFGNDILNEDKTINRSKLRDIVFSNPNSKNKLESIIHPEVRKKISSEVITVNSPYCIIVVPLLIEANFLDLVDRTLVVNAKKSIRIQRIITRDNLSKEDVEKIIGSQSSDADKLKIADDVIENNNSNNSVFDEVKKLHEKYLSLSQ